MKWVANNSDIHRVARYNASFIFWDKSLSFKNIYSKFSGNTLLRDRTFLKNFCPFLIFTIEVIYEKYKCICHAIMQYASIHLVTENIAKA